MSAYKASAIIIFLIVIGKVSGFLKDLLLTYYHGVSTVTDAYFLASSISSVLYMAVFSSIPIVVIPLCAEGRKQFSDSHIEKLLRMLMMYIMLSFGFAVAIWLFAPQLVSIFAGELDAVTRVYAVDYVTIMSVTFVFSAVVSFFNSLQLSEKNILPFYFTPIVNNIIFCSGLMLFSNEDNFYIVLILGIASWVLLLLGNYSSVSDKFDFKNLGGTKVVDYWHVFQLALPAMLTLYIDQINGVMAIFFSAEIGDGAVTIMSYGNKLNGVFLSVFVVILTTIIYPKIADKVSNGDVDGLTNTMSKYLKLFIFAGLPVIIAMSHFSKELVSIIFERGSFDRDAVNGVSAVFSIVILGLVLNLIRDLINRVFFAWKKTSIVMYLSVAAVTMNFVLSFIWYENYALIGLAYAGVVSLLLNVLLLLYLVDKFFDIKLIGVVIKMFLTFCIAGTGAVVCLMLSKQYGIHDFLQYFMAALTYIWVLFIISYVANKRIEM